MQLGIWIGLCFGAAFLLRTRPRFTVGAVLFLWFLVPTVGSSTITGIPSGPLSLHAASWLIFAVFLTRLLEKPASFRIALGRHFILFVALLVVLVAAFLASRTSSSGGGMVLLLDQMLAPILFFLLLLSVAVTDQGLVPRLRTLLLFLVAVVCVIALIQWLTHSVLFYEQGFQTQYWFNPMGDRWMGTLDQPLALSLAIAVAAPLVAGLNRGLVQTVLLLLMIVGILITQSRVGLFILALSLVMVVFFGRGRVWVKAVLLAILSYAATAIVSSPLFAGVAARLEDDTGSAEARALAFEYFLEHWADYLIAGQGIGASYRVAVQGGLETSFENPLVMYSVDFGIVFAVLYFGCMVFLVLRNAFRHHVRGLTLAGLLAVAVPQTYSSLGTRSAAGIIVWTVLAMIVIAGDAAAAQRREATAARPSGTFQTRRAKMIVDTAGRAA